MSLIEQAAKRLEELRRAGADLTETPASSATGEANPSDAPPPTPEAVVRALESRAAQSSPQLLLTPASVPFPSVRAPRRIDIDLADLGARGYLTPDAAKSQTADEFRVIKRPIIRNALGLL